MSDTTPPPSDQATAAPSTQPALDAVQVALDRRDNGGEAAMAGHRRINCAAAGNDHLGQRTAQASRMPAQPARKTRRNM